MEQQTRLTIISKLIFGASFLSLYAAPAQASSIHVSATSYGYEPDLGDFSLDFKPMGAALGGSIDINEALSFQFEFGQWKDDDALNGQSTADFKSTLISLGMEYSVNNWTLNAIYTDISDETDVIHGDQLEFNSSSDADLMSLRLSAAYEKKNRQLGLLRRRRFAIRRSGHGRNF